MCLVPIRVRSIAPYRPMATATYSPVGSKPLVKPKSLMAVRSAALLRGRLLLAATAAFVVTATTRRGHQGQGEGKSHQTNLLSSLAHQSSLLLGLSWSVTFVGARVEMLPPSSLPAGSPLRGTERVP